MLRVLHNVVNVIRIGDDGCMRRPRTTRDEEAVRHFVEHMAHALSEWGFPRMPARVLVVMMAAEEDRLDAAELAARLDVSPAAISGAVRYLTHVGMVERVPVAGSRRDGYRLPDDGWYVASVEKQALYASFAAVADTGVSALGGAGTTAGARVARMRDFMLFVQDEMDGMLRRWHRVQRRRG